MSTKTLKKSKKTSRPKAKSPAYVRRSLGTALSTTSMRGIRQTSTFKPKVVWTEDREVREAVRQINEWKPKEKSAGTLAGIIIIGVFLFAVFVLFSTGL